MDAATIFTNFLLTAGITLVCLVSFYFIQWTKGTTRYKFLLLAWCVPAFLMLLILNFAVRASLLWACISFGVGLAIGLGIILPVYFVRKKNAPAQEAAPAQPMDYPHFVADRLLNIGLHHVEFVTPEEKAAFDLRAKDSYGQKVCVKCLFSTGAIAETEVQALFDAQQSGGFARAIFFSNASFSEEARALARNLQIELVERFRQ